MTVLKITYTDGWIGLWMKLNWCVFHCVCRHDICVCDCVNVTYEYTHVCVCVNVCAFACLLRRLRKGYIYLNALTISVNSQQACHNICLPPPTAAGTHSSQRVPGSFGS